MKKILEKNELIFSIILIIIYVVLNSYCIQNFGTTSYKSTIVNTLISIILLTIIYKTNKQDYYGLKKVKNKQKFLYFIPLIPIATINIWNGFNINNTTSEILFHILTMINVGFIEEVIFRGFLFKAISKESIKKGIIISSITFGIGHIVNLINGSPLIPTIIQIIYAISLGYLFVIIFYKSKSLLPCIITHAIINSLSIFNVSKGIKEYIFSLILIIISLSYAIYINKKIKEEDNK